MSVLSCLGLGSLGYRASRHPTPTVKTSPPLTPTGFPQLSPLPTLGETWECSVIVVGGSLGGVAAASHAMQTGAKTCLIEVSPWVGGQISSQGVSAVDESLAMRAKQNYSTSWSNFKQLIAQQPINLPAWTNSSPRQVKDINSCWVGKLCFPPKPEQQQQKNC